MAPDSTTTRAPNRSLSAPQAKPATPRVRKSSVMALEIPARVQPVDSAIGCRNTASEAMAPMPTQVISAPEATTTQPYRVVMARLFSCAVRGPGFA